MNGARARDDKRRTHRRAVDVSTRSERRSRNVPVVARVTRFHFVTTPHTAAGVTLSSPAPEESAPETFRRAVFTVEIPPPADIC